MKNEKCLLTVLFAVCLLASNPAWAWKMAKCSIPTRWASDVTPENVLSEYPRPQMVRSEWQNLNGLWQWQSTSSWDAALTTTWSEILVPFVPEAPLSGIGKHAETMAYRRTFTVPSAWSGKRVLLHFEAVDWRCEAWVDGQSVGRHDGGYDPFSFDITEALGATEEHELLVRVYDPTDKDAVPRGKQVLNPGGIFYTSSSGIWQTVWLESVEPTYIADYRVVPDIDKGTVAVSITTGGTADASATYSVQVLHGTTVVAAGTAGVGETLTLPIDQPELWSPDHPFLYDMVLTLGNDEVKGYFGMRKIALKREGTTYRLAFNNQFLFQMGPLDQGFWPDGIYTAPTDEALKSDIVTMKKMGFNMVRKHIKVEPRRWYYWCDRLGLMVWQDMPGENYGGQGGVANNPDYFDRELRALVNTHYNVPSIIMWVVFNEGGGQGDGNYTKRFVDLVRSLDKTRLIDEASGWNHYGYGDLKDIHPYPSPSYTTTTKKQAMACGEYGGLKYALKGHTWSSDGWGYASVESPEALDEQYTEYARKLAYYKSFKGLSAAVYTQLTDVEVEVNGLMSYDRIVKSDLGRLYTANRIAIESEGQPMDWLLSPADEKGETWRYTTTQPNDTWNKPDFDDSAWRQGKAGFGANGQPNMQYGTRWTTPDIWIRRTLDLDLDPADLARLTMRVYYDEDTEIYINGVQIYKVTGYVTDYQEVALSNAARAALNPHGSNVIAAHTHQTDGGQFIDIAFYVDKGTPTFSARQAVRATVAYDRSSELSFTIGYATDTTATAPLTTSTYTRLPFAQSAGSATLGLDDSRLLTPQELLFDVTTLLSKVSLDKPLKLFFQVNTAPRGEGQGAVSAVRFEEASTGVTFGAAFTPTQQPLQGGDTMEMMTAIYDPATAQPVVPAEPEAGDLAFTVATSCVVKGEKVYLHDASGLDASTLSWAVNGAKENALIQGSTTSFIPTTAGSFSVAQLNASDGTRLTMKDAFTVCNAASGQGLSFSDGAALTFASPLTARSYRFSFDWWMKPTGSLDGCLRIYETARTGFFLSAADDGSLTVTSSDVTASTQAGFIVPDEWHHYSVVYYYSKYYFYRDCVLIASGNGPNITPVWEDQLVVEGRQVILDEFRFWGGKLTVEKLRKFSVAPADLADEDLSTFKLSLYCPFEGDASNVMNAAASGQLTGPYEFVSSAGVFCYDFEAASGDKEVTSTYLTNAKAPFLTTSETANAFDATRFLVLEHGTEQSTWQGDFLTPQTAGVCVDKDSKSALLAAAGWFGTASTLIGSRLWQTVSLPAGVYTLSVTTTSADNAWQSLLVASEGSELATLESIAAGCPVLGKTSLADGALTFSLPTDATVSLGVVFYLPYMSSVAISRFQLMRHACACLTANGEEYTAITLPERDDEASDAPLYDLQGRRITTLPTSGIYIRGGKKILVK